MQQPTMKQCAGQRKKNSQPEGNVPRHLTPDNHPADIQIHHTGNQEAEQDQNLNDDKTTRIETKTNEEILQQIETQDTTHQETAPETHKEPPQRQVTDHEPDQGP